MHASTHTDVRFEAESLLSLARQKSQESRSRLAMLMVELFDSSAATLSEHEHAQIYRILHDVVFDVEMSARRTIATQIAGRPDVPRDLIVALANDTIEIAYPILAKSSLLRDEDLIEIVRHRSIEHQLTIAGRDGIGEAVCAELAGTGRESVVVTLLKNKSAKISAQTMEYLVEQSQRVNAFREPILTRADIRPDVAKRMFTWVSLALRDHIIANFPINPREVDDLIERTIAIEAERLAAGADRSKKKSEALAKAMDEEGEITPDLLIAALREAEFPLCVALFGRLTGLRDYLITRFLFEPSGEGLAIACKAAGMGKATFAAIYGAAHKMEPIQINLSRVLEFFDSFSAEAAQAAVRQWQRGADYLNAVREFTLSRQESEPKT